MGTSHARNDAETARMIAAFGNLHVGKMSRSKPEARRFKIGDILRARTDFQERGGWRRCISCCCLLPFHFRRGKGSVSSRLLQLRQIAHDLPASAFFLLLSA